MDGIFESNGVSCTDVARVVLCNTICFKAVGVVAVVVVVIVYCEDGFNMVW